MTDWEDLRHFAALSETGSLSGAARLIGVEHATVARRVARLEAQTGLKLVDRRGRRFRITAEGEKIAGILCAMQEAAASIGERLRATDAAAAGADAVERLIDERTRTTA